MHPYEYCITCDKCNGTNIEWSEYEHKIWCYDCKIDTDGFPGIFGGPIPMGLTELLGISLDRWNAKKHRVEHMKLVGHKIKWFAKPSKKE